MTRFSHIGAPAQRPAAAATAAAGGGAPRGAATPRGAMRQSSGDPVRGEADGPAYRLPSGLLIQRRRVGTHRISEAELGVIAQSLQRLPAAHQQLLARMGITVELLPLAALEGGIVGSTELRQQGDGSWRPWLVRIAMHSGRGGNLHPAEVAQHEVGHVVGMVQHGNDTEEYANQYAQRH